MQKLFIFDFEFQNTQKELCINFYLNANFITDHFTQLTYTQTKLKKSVWKQFMKEIKCKVLYLHKKMNGCKKNTVLELHYNDWNF